MPSETELLLYYRTGKRDAACEILMMRRSKTAEDVLLEIAKQVIDSDNGRPNPHAAWLIAQNPDKTAGNA